MEKSMEFLQKLKMELPYDQGIPLLSIYEENKSINSKRFMYPCVHCSIIHNSQVMKATLELSMDEWIKKVWCIYKMEY